VHFFILSGHKGEGQLLHSQTSHNKSSILSGIGIIKLKRKIVLTTDLQIPKNQLIIALATQRLVIRCKQMVKGARPRPKVLTCFQIQKPTMNK